LGKLGHCHLGMGRGWPLATRFSPISVTVPNLVILGQPYEGNYDDPPEKV